HGLAEGGEPPAEPRLPRSFERLEGEDLEFPGRGHGAVRGRDAAEHAPGQVCGVDIVAGPIHRLASSILRAFTIATFVPARERKFLPVAAPASGVFASRGHAADVRGPRIATAGARFPSGHVDCTRVQTCA